MNCDIHGPIRTATALMLPLNLARTAPRIAIERIGPRGPAQQDSRGQQKSALVVTNEVVLLKH